MLSLLSCLWIHFDPDLAIEKVASPRVNDYCIWRSATPPSCICSVMKFCVRKQRGTENAEQFVTHVLKLYEVLNPHLNKQRLIEHTMRMINPKIRDFLEVKKPQDWNTLCDRANMEQKRKYQAYNRNYRRSRFPYSQKRYTNQESHSVRPWQNYW